jgi:hypothetical protein
MKVKSRDEEKNNEVEGQRKIVFAEHELAGNSKQSSVQEKNNEVKGEGMEVQSSGEVPFFGCSKCRWVRGGCISCKDMEVQSSGKEKEFEKPKAKRCRRHISIEERQELESHLRVNRGSKLVTT